jgi:hypothetical protein
VTWTVVGKGPEAPGEAAENVDKGPQCLHRAGRFLPCSPRHRRHCSPAHAEFVDAYRALLDQAVRELEATTGMWAGDVAAWRAAGHRLPTLHDLMVRR